MTLPVTGVSELVLEVADLAAAERFYTGVLGLPVIERWPEREAVWLLAGERTRIGLWRPQVGVAGGRGGVHVHFALHIPEPDFDAAVASIRVAGLEPQLQERRRFGRARSRSAYIDDPDGNCVELWTQDVAGYRLPRTPAQVPSEALSPNHFDATAERWDREYDQRTLRGHWWRTRLDAVVRLAGAGPGSLLEIGVGSGRLLAALAEHGWTVTGIDPAARMVELARDRAHEASLLVARAEALPFDAGSFDAVVGVGVVEYTDIERSLREMVRVLRSGGRAVIGLRNGSAATMVWSGTVVQPAAQAVKRVVPFGRPVPTPRRAALSRTQACALVQAAGLIVESVEEVGCAVLPDPLDALFGRLAVRAAEWAEASPPLRRALGTQRIILATKP